MKTITTNIPTFQSCMNIVNWIKDDTPLNLPEKKLNTLFSDDENIRFIFKNLYRESLVELRDFSFSLRLTSIFRKINLKTLRKIHPNLTEMVTYSNKKNFFQCADAIQNVCNVASLPIAKTITNTTGHTSEVSSDRKSVV